MKWFAVIALAFSGCYYLGQNSYKEIVLYPSSEWSSPENLTMIMEAGNHNLRDNRTNIKAIVTPYYPSVIKAIGRRAQEQYHWTEEEFRNYVNNLLRESSGMFIDWDQPAERLYDALLNPLETPLQYDSLLVLLTLRNIGWPCGKYIIGPSGQIIPLDNPDCNAPDITHLEGNIILVNEENMFITPTIVWGKRMNYLTNIEETFFVKFKLRDGDHHFLEHSRRFFLSIKGLEGDIRLELSTELMR